VNKPKITRRLIRLMLWGAALLLCQMSGADPPPSAGEYQVKSVYVFNLTRFVEWPESTFEPARCPFIVGVIGENPFGQSLEETLRRENVRGHPLVIQLLKSGDLPGNCQILFICRSEAKNLESLLKQVEGRAILTVSDLDGCAARGVMVNLPVVQGSVKIEINRAQAELSQLKMSSKLLSLAKIVETEK
jgi:hypothetical protein